MKFLEELDNEYCTKSTDWRDANISGCSRPVIVPRGGHWRVQMQEKRFQALGGEVVSCGESKRKFGHGDSEKRFCWMDQKESNDCVVFSVGSRNAFDFEMDMAKKTNCRFEVFDCTVQTPRVPGEIANRTRFHKLCLGAKTTEPGKGKMQFVNYTEMLKVAGSVPSYVKFDIEGAEYDVMSNIIDSSRKHYLETGENIEPLQLAFELHYATRERSFTSWAWFRTKTNGELFSFAQMLLESGGYLIADIRINNPYCAEIVIVKAL
eukprot:CAMPEP_0182448720 /NCGR_PEP_ID=MMETSP1172-20130603/29114_1 /TAXON_ID=708627 /ORGANISM="Timspurckia oligopyrenoides, Strain CCMP3278" /LENGTH=263 /DNA_ID=CAMNT_0024645683 /DNA_START=319 /DNA_END=1107 /DNA_ORIENTATION=-